MKTEIKSDFLINKREYFGLLFNNLNLLENGLELGVADGYFSDIIRKSWKGKYLHLIDRWIHIEGYIDTANKTNDEFTKNLKRVVDIFESNPSVIIHKIESSHASLIFPSNYFDWIFIDADHSYKGTMLDLKNWYPKLKSNGIFCGHDYIDGILGETQFGVKSAVDEFIMDKNVVLYITLDPIYKSWYFLKP